MTAAIRDTAIPAADVCLVGAGPVGLAMAFRLEELGFSVTLIEMGAHESGNVHKAGDLELQNGHHASWSAMSRPGIGGASALWGGRCVTFDDIDFEVRDHVPHSGWPIPHDSLSRYYRDALSFLGCNTQEPSFKEAPAGDTVRSGAVERWSKQPDLGPASTKRLLRSTRIRLIGGRVTDIVLSDSGAHVECLTVLTATGEVCVTAKSFVLAGGGLENARLMLALQQKVPQLWGGEDGPLGRFYQGHLTGYIAVLHFKQPAAAERFSFRRDEQGYIYRNRLQIAPAAQMENGLLNCVFWLDPISIADPVHGSGALSFIYLVLRVSGLYRRFSAGLAPTTRAASGINWREHFKNIRSDRRWIIDVFGALRNVRRRRLDRWRTIINPKGRYLLRYHSEQVPNPQSRIFLQSGNGNTTAANLTVDYKVADQDITSVLKSHHLLDEWLRSSGIGRLQYLNEPQVRGEAVLRQAFDGYHQIGLTRMAASRREGVADEDCRVYDVDNLYLAGSCLFPTGGHANPTLPAVALALRLAEHLRGLLARESAP